MNDFGEVVVKSSHDVCGIDRVAADSETLLLALLALLFLMLHPLNISSG